MSVLFFETKSLIGAIHHLIHLRKPSPDRQSHGVDAIGQKTLVQRKDQIQSFVEHPHLQNGLLASQKTKIV